jgi:hypothetical protein
MLLLAYAAVSFATAVLAREAWAASAVDAQENACVMYSGTEMLCYL